MKVFLNAKQFLEKELDDQAEGPVKYYLVKTSFTCGAENFLEVDGRSFEHDLSSLGYQKVTAVGDFSKFRRQYESAFK